MSVRDILMSAAGGSEPSILATDVFSPTTYTGNGATQTITNGLNLAGKGGLVWLKERNLATGGHGLFDTVRGVTKKLATNSTTAEATTSGVSGFNANGFAVGTDTDFNSSGENYVAFSFCETTKVVDIVPYTATGAIQTVSHNLGVVPELMIVKTRSSTGFNWAVYTASQGATKKASLNTTTAFGASSPMWNNTAPTSTVFTIGGGDDTNPVAGATMIAYLFASFPGVSKIGNYTGNGTTQTINCGFSGGARFVLIKRTNGTGGWYLYDTARGMTTGTNPYLLSNTAQSDTATLGSVTSVTTGFAVNAAVLAQINISAADYFFFAIA